MRKMAESLGAVYIYIYIYIVNFRRKIIRKLNRINKKHRLYRKIDLQFFCIGYAFDTS